MYCFYFNTFPHHPKLLKHCVSAVKVSFIFRSVCLSLLWLTVPVCLWAWPAGTSNHSGHLGGPNVTRFHPFFLPAVGSKMEAEHTGEEAFSTSSFHRPYISPSTSPQQTRIIGHIINFTAAVWVWVLSELSEALCLSPELKGYMPWHRLTPRLRTAFYYRVAATFWRLPHTLLSGHNPQTQPNESKSAQGKSKGRSNTDCPTQTHTHTHKEQRRNTVPFPLF